jgi:hypothetical protein
MGPSIQWAACECWSQLTTLEGKELLLRMPVKWPGDSGDLGQHRSEATLDVPA